MSTTVHLYSDTGMRFECDDDDIDPTIWIRDRARGISVSLSFTCEDRAKLRAVLAEADESEASKGGEA